MINHNELLEKINSLQVELTMINTELKDIKETLKLLTKSAGRMDNHISFIELTYDTLKAPLNYIVDKINYLNYIPIPSMKIDYTE